MSKAEQWKPIDGYESVYEVSSLGRVRSAARTDFGGRFRKQRVLRPTKNAKGYLFVALFKDGKRQRMAAVHRLVLETFVGPAPKGAEACHNNGRRDDNRLCNLRWDSRTGNQRDRVNHGTANKEMGHPRRKIDLDTAIEMHRARSRGLTIRQIASMNGLTHSYVSKLLRGRYWPSAATQANGDFQP